MVSGNQYGLMVRIKETPRNSWNENLKINSNAVATYRDNA